MESKSCIFCKIIAGELPAQIIAEDEHCLVIKDVHPKAPIHYLVMPKKHIADIQSIDPQDLPLINNLFSQMQHLSKTIAQADAFNVVINNGAAAGQIIFHLHFHFLAGKKLFNL